ncbi:4'-phosphopantetheinyl transferase [Flavobacteriaceae bacterium MAR_2009_75]|nr:4'-phosphopantetheinyl transferase [Flavobacteriaceae bacterium MAR_2009_75]
MKLPENEVHIWYFDVEEFEKDLDFYNNYLSTEELLRSQRFKFEKDRKINVLARSSLRILSGKYLGCEPEKIKIAYEEFDKPYLVDYPDFKFNVSHSGQYVALAFVKNFKCGVDIERIKNDFDVLEIADNFFSPSEIEQLHNVPKNQLFIAFYRLWTRKESFIKAKGSGLSFPLSSFSVSLDKNAHLLSTDWDSDEKHRWSMTSFEPAPGYQGALSVQGTLNKISIEPWKGVQDQ